MNGRAKIEQLSREIDQVIRLRCSPSDDTLKRWKLLLTEALAGEGPWYTEDRAARRGIHASRWFRVRFPAWEAMGYARLRDGRREYHEAVVPVEPARGALDDPERQAAKDEAA